MSGIIIGGLAGSGTTTAASLVAERRGWQHVNAGALFRELAAEAMEPPEQFLVGRSRAIDDRVLTQCIAQLRSGQVVLESRTAAWLIPHSDEIVAVWLTCSVEERARRLSARDPGVSDGFEQVSYRDATEARRYHDLYGIDLEDLSVFDAVLDTTARSACAIRDAIIEVAT